MRNIHLFKAKVEWVEYHKENEEISIGGSLNVDNIKDSEIEDIIKSIEESSMTFVVNKNGDSDE